MKGGYSRKSVLTGTCFFPDCIVYYVFRACIDDFYGARASIVTFMELNLIMWTSYLVLLFCYDENFIGEHSPVTALVAFLMFEKRVN